MAGHLGNPHRTRRNASVKTPFGLSAALPLQMFLENILPPLQDGLNPRNVLEALRKGQKSHNLITEQNRWKGFETDPKHSGLSDYHTFMHLEAVVASVVDLSRHVVNDVDLPLRLESNPTPVAKYRYSSNTTFPDASFLKGSELGWEKIAVCGEYETDEVPEYVDDVSVDLLNSAP